MDDPPALSMPRRPDGRIDWTVTYSMLKAQFLRTERVSEEDYELLHRVNLLEIQQSEETRRVEAERRQTEANSRLEWTVEEFDDPETKEKILAISQLEVEIVEDDRISRVERDAERIEEEHRVEAERHQFEVNRRAEWTFENLEVSEQKERAIAIAELEAEIVEDDQILADYRAEALRTEQEAERIKEARQVVVERREAEATRRHLILTKQEDWTREYTARAEICSDLREILATKIKLKKRTYRRKIKQQTWTMKDLALCKVPKQHREFTFTILEREKDQRQGWREHYDPEADERPNWPEEVKQGEIANWAMSPKLGDQLEASELEWWRDMFRWIYGKEIEVVKGEHRRKLLKGDYFLGHHWWLEKEFAEKSVA